MHMQRCSSVWRRSSSWGQLLCLLIGIHRRCRVARAPVGAAPALTWSSGSSSTGGGGKLGGTYRAMPVEAESPAHGRQAGWQVSNGGVLGGGGGAGAGHTAAEAACCLGARLVVPTLTELLRGWPEAVCRGAAFEASCS